MQEKLQFKEKISFVLNGQPIEPGQVPEPPVTRVRRDQLEQEERDRSRSPKEEND